MVELEGDPIDNFPGHILGLEAETRIDFAITFLFPVKHPAPTANHQPFSQLSEVIREVRPVGDVVSLVVVVDVGVVVDERVLGRFGRRLVAGTSLAEVGESIPASTPETRKTET